MVLFRKGGGGQSIFLEMVGGEDFSFYSPSKYIKEIIIQNQKSEYSCVFLKAIILKVVLMSTRTELIKTAVHLLASIQPCTY